MEGDFIKIYDWLRPLSWLYGLGVGFRNQLFELGILRSRSFSVPVISVGNITVGGSGKTPHVEYLIRLLQDKAKVAVLSRGYKRKSRGYLLAEDDTPMRLIGAVPDEAQVSEDPCRGGQEALRGYRSPHFRRGYLRHRCRAPRRRLPAPLCQTGHQYLARRLPSPYPLR